MTGLLETRRLHACLSSDPRPNLTGSAAAARLRLIAPFANLESRP